MSLLSEKWQELLGPEMDKKYMIDLFDFLRNEKSYCPTKYDIFRAFTLGDFDNVRVVILGQDPYPTLGSANGLAFAVNDTVHVKPPALLNIFREVEMCTGQRVDRSKSNLIPWAVQGVLLLNTILTVTPGAPMSHRGKGWECFTDEAILALACRTEPLVFMLWGGLAAAKKPLLEGTPHLVLESTHPSPLSANKGPIDHRFVGCRHFAKANEWLVERGQHPISWNVTG